MLIHPGANSACARTSKHVIMKRDIRKKYSTWRKHKYACDPAELCTYICAVFIQYVSFLMTFFEHSIGTPSFRGNGFIAKSGTEVHIAVKDDNPGQNKKGIILIKRVKYNSTQ